ncbi:MAG: class II D-tagatose-bisphosphate aldolase, non-catalytic subunit [Paracoccaceae bacterium]
MTDLLRKTIAQNRAGQAVALPSVCSAHPDVLTASLLLARDHNRPLIIEATSNQVNQDGGYVRMRPADFVKFVNNIAENTGFDRSQIIFGGDHLGPQVWRAQPADQAMAKAEVLVADYVRAGFTKIHLDCSEGCAGEPAQVDDATSAARAAQLAAICEAAAPDASALSYMVGTEVPPPGGARVDEDDTITPTSPASATATLRAHFDAFDQAGVAAAKSRIAALVVQPGVEFSPTEVHHLPANPGTVLKDALVPYDGVCFEAHSTDYQRTSAYPAMAHMGFAIHKVGPALTFAYRQAVYALDALRQTVHGPSASLPDTMETLMLANPANWQGHYHGTDDAMRLLRHYSYADRIRYYWAQPAAQAAIAALITDIDANQIPAPVWMQYFCPETESRAANLRAIGYSPANSRILASIQSALSPYFFDSIAAGTK